MDEAELASSTLGLTSPRQDFISVPGQPRPAPGVLLVSTMLTERWERKPDFPHCVELPSSGVSELSARCPHWLQVRNWLSDGSLGRQDRDESENEVFLQSSAT